MINLRKTISGVVVFIVVFAMGFVATMGHVLALDFSMSPMKEKIVLTPGQKFHGSLKITNPASSEEDFAYRAGVEAISFDEGYNMSFGDTQKYSDIVKWISVKNPTGVVRPNETATIYFDIDVPSDAPAGSQYAAITVGTVESEGAGNLNIKQNVQMAHIIYANVAGETIYDASVSDIELPSFMFSGSISGSALVKNNGNSYVNVERILQVFPLFSDEEVYTNEEDPDSSIVLPESQRRTITSWDETPSIGIFNVRYTVMIDGEEAGHAEKLVIICPLWLMVVIVFGIVSAVIYLVTRSKSRKNAKKNDDIAE